MRIRGTLALAFTLAMTALVSAADKEVPVYELRTYYATPGRLDDLNARFRDHTLALFEKHGLQNIGYWMPVDNTDNALVYLLAFPSQEARAKAWKEFSADPQWQKVRQETEANGKIVTKVESVQMAATDYSPETKPSAGKDRVFELRIYTAAPGNLDRLNARFRDHTVALFKRHGMEQLGYWNPLEGQPGAGEKLIYLLAHASQEAAKASFDAFRADPEWVAARKASEDAAGGPLTVKDGVKSVFMKATDYSPTK
ncbi:MAG: NIPSNAP family protein [Thermoguttaceae bacterium]